MQTSVKVYNKRSSDQCKVNCVTLPFLGPHAFPCVPENGNQKSQWIIDSCFTDAAVAIQGNAKGNKQL